ncbi:cyclin-G1-like [Crassostrea virginica]|uniref:Cyclin-G1-like n=1 Tax=Crassostrea virginica TaxID=6565 RepID=A0A8B8D2N3_CRAVI|nr:cyclin-G1-like [Crassostrea virginica]
MVQDKVICTQRDITKLFDSIMYQNQLCVLSKIRSCPSEISTKCRKKVEKLMEKTKRCGHHQKGSSLCTQRDNAVSTIRCLTHFYSCSPATYATAVSCLDRFLAKVKVQPKYYSCVAAACFYLSSKFHDEDENAPSATQLSNLMQHAWKSSDLKRMELVILEKLDWNLLIETCPSLLRTLCDIVQTFTLSQVLDHLFLVQLVQKFETCINYSSCAIFSTASMALALLHHNLHENDLLTNTVRQCVLDLQSICQVSDAEFYECQAAISTVLDNYKNSPKTHPPCLPTPKPFVRPNLVSRPSLYGDSELPAIEEVPCLELVGNKSESEIQVKYVDQKFGNTSWSTCILPQKCATCTLE